ncbi:MAG: hypothetical protein M0Q13_11660 [Methanothrix sp.]|jgi:hypothetical protein|nr:hypothetical protein [Methanothrix sp.]
MDKEQKTCELIEDTLDILNSYDNLKKRISKILKSNFLNREVECRLDKMKYIIKENGIYSIVDNKIDEYVFLRFDFLLDLFFVLFKIDFNVKF